MFRKGLYAPSFTHQSTTVRNAAGTLGQFHGMSGPSARVVGVNDNRLRTSAIETRSRSATYRSVVTEYLASSGATMILRRVLMSFASTRLQEVVLRSVSP